MVPSRKMSAELVKIIKDLISTGNYAQHQIAAMLGINQGRVSEVKRGDYD